MTTNDASELTSATRALQWEAARDDVQALSLYTPDWDGEGADRVPFVLIQATLRWLARLEACGGPVPSVVYPTAGGTPVVEWHASDGSSYVGYVRKTDRIDMVYQLPGADPTHVVMFVGTKMSDSPDEAGPRDVGFDRGDETGTGADVYDDLSTDSDCQYWQAA